MSAPEDLLAFQFKAIGIAFEREYRIHPARRFRADFWLPGPRLVIEIEGGAFTNGRHSRGTGIRNDAEKSALIAAMPARLIRVLPEHVKDGRALKWIEAAS